MIIPVVILISLFVLLKLLEFIWPLRQATSHWLTRLGINLCMAVLVFITASLIIVPTSDYLVNWTWVNQIGLLHYLALPLFLQVIIGFLLMDVSFYYWHRLNHSLPILWRFHNVHHIDPDLDVSTSFRFHFVEIIYSVFFRFVQLLIIGVNPIVFAAYEFCFQANTMFHHSNIKLPIRFERLINKLIVTPRMHGIHHSQVMQETNANYSVVFSFWDRLHRSLRLNIPQKEITIGVPAYYKAQDNRLWALLKVPFVKQRRYWRSRTANKIRRDGLTASKYQLAE